MPGLQLHNIIITVYTDVAYSTMYAMI